MIRTLEATGKTVEEARAKACAQLGVEADALNVSFEVLEMPQKTGFLGLKLIPAKVRVSVEEPDPAIVPEVEVQPAAALEMCIRDSPRAGIFCPASGRPGRLPAHLRPAHAPWLRPRSHTARRISAGHPA